MAILMSVIGLGLIAFGNAANNQFHDGSGTSLLDFGVVLLVISVLPWIGVIIASVRRTRIERGVPRALTVWQVVWAAGGFTH